MVSPASSAFRSESSGTKAPFTNTSRRASMPGNGSSVFAALIAAASGGGARGAASRISARRSVYFHSSIRRCGSPLSRKDIAAFSRSFATGFAFENFARAVSIASASACSAGVRIGFTSAFMASRRLFEGGIALFFEFEREFRSAGAHDLALRHHVHDVRHDVVEKALIVGDDDDRALL